MPLWGWVVVAVVAVDAVGLLALLHLVRTRRAAAGRRAEVGRGGAPALLEDRQAVYRGRARRREVVGTGHLTLTDDLLVFAQWVPRREIRIPRHRILTVDRTRHHAGRIGPTVLRVRYRSAAGAEEAVGFTVRDPAAWEAALGGAARP